MDHGPRQALPAEVSFPYGFPRAGDYRLFVRVKRHGVVETGVFDAPRLGIKDAEDAGSIGQRIRSTE
jgi:hypothetical protein